MKAVAYALLLLFLPACRLSQPPVVAAKLEALAAPAIVPATPPAARISSATVTIAGARAADLARQLPASLHQVEARRRWGRKTVRLGPCIRSARMPRAGQRVATTVAIEPGSSLASGLILVGVGAAIALTSFLIVQNATTFGSALILSFTFGLGIALVVAGCLLSLFTYLLALYEKRRMARVDKPKK